MFFLIPAIFTYGNLLFPLPPKSLSDILLSDMIMKRQFYYLVLLAMVGLVMAGCKKDKNAIEEDSTDQSKSTAVFSVSNSMKVRFSQGNLQYQASSKRWRFAEHQWDIIGNDNDNISGSYDGWIDLFAWGTGDDPTNVSTDATEFTKFIDWGTSMFVNGSSDERWRTLTDEEWSHLFFTRQDAEQLRSQATVCGVHGYVLLPDGCHIPNGVSWTALSQDWFTNDYDANRWQQLEKAGAVFLPCGGYRYSTSTYYVNSYGIYWSATMADSEDDEPKTRCVYFTADGAYPDYTFVRYFGLSVRLVSEL